MQLTLCVTETSASHLHVKLLTFVLEEKISKLKKMTVIQFALGYMQTIRQVSPQT
jgi:hypothetical protein